MPIERRIREGADRNAGVLDPDVDRFLDSVVRRTRRRKVVRRSFTGAAAAAAVALAVFVGPSVLDGIEGANGHVPGGNPTPSVAPSVPPIVPFLTGTFTRSIPTGTAVVRANDLAGTWTISATADGVVRLLGPDGFDGARASAPFEMQATNFRTDALRPDVCTGMASGTYTWSVQDGFLLISVVSDPCDARIVVLTQKPWRTGS